MVSLGSLWLPILLSAVLVFFASFLIHMVLKFHHKDYTKLPNEDAVRAAIRAGNPAPAQYIFPYCADPKDMQKPEMKQKYLEGPIGVLNLMRPQIPNMGKSLTQWFVLVLLVSLFIGYIGAHTLAPGTKYLEVFRVLGAVGFLAYGVAQLPDAIWMGKPWNVALKALVDALLYGLVTAGTFGWLWPK